MIAATLAAATASVRLTACRPPMPPAPITPMLTVLLICHFRSVVECGFNHRLPVGAYQIQRTVSQRS